MQEAARRYAEDARRRAGVPIHIRVGVNSGEVVVRSIGGDLKMDYTAVRRDYPRQAHELIGRRRADALEDLSGRGASGRPVSFTTVSPGSRACSVRGPSEDRREHRKDSSLLMRSSSQNRQARTADGRCQEPGGARVRARGGHARSEILACTWGTRKMRVPTHPDRSFRRIVITRSDRS